MTEGLSHIRKHDAGLSPLIPLGLSVITPEGDLHLARRWTYDGTFMGIFAILERVTLRSKPSIPLTKHEHVTGRHVHIVFQTIKKATGTGISQQMDTIRGIQKR